MTAARRIVAIGTVAAGTALAVAGTALPASAKPGDVVVRGSCSAASDWKLKLAPRDGRIEVEYEVDSNVVGQTWSVRIFHNGVRFTRTTATTVAPSGSFTVRRVVANLAGSDTVRAVSTNPATGETCTGRATL